MAETLKADLFDLKDVNMDVIGKYDLIGFGSGKYFLRPHKKLRNFVEKMDDVNSKKAFVFSTSGDGKPMGWLEKNLSKKGFDVLGEFYCKGFDTYAFAKIIHRGGLNKGNHDKKDLENARNFAESLKKKF